MSKTVDAGLQTHLESEETATATCWHVTRTDGTEYFFTDHDQDILYGGDIYLAESGYTATSAEVNAGLNVDDIEIEGAISSASITEADMMAGLWDYAEVWVFLINWRDPTNIVKLRRGRLGMVSTRRSTFVAELRGLMQHLQQPIGRVVTAGCDANFGDTRCGMNLSLFTFSGTVASASSNRIFVASGLDLQENNAFQFGKITWTSGNNTGQSGEIRTTDSATGEVQLFLPMAFEIEAADGFDASFGCSKSKVACMTFGNIVNFRGFPDKPRQDQVIQGPEC